MHEETGENLVALMKPNAPVIRVRTIARRPIDERWVAESVFGVRAEPRRPHPKMPENTEVLTHGQAQIMKADEDLDKEMEGEEQEGQYDNRDGEEGNSGRQHPDQQEVEESGAALEQAEVEDEEEVTRINYRITKRLIEDLGASPGCQACENTSWSWHSRTGAFDGMQENV